MTQQANLVEHHKNNNNYILEILTKKFEKKNVFNYIIYKIYIYIMYDVQELQHEQNQKCNQLCITACQSCDLYK